MSLRMVEMVVRDAEASDFAALSDKLKVLGLWRERLDDDQVLLRLLVPSERTEAVIEHLQSEFQTSPAFRLVIFEVQATVPQPPPDEPDKKDENGETEKDPARIACAELVQRLSTGAVVNRIFIVTVALSTIVAAIGLMQDNVAIIIGAMVIAPLLAPNMTLALATTLGDPKLARRAMRVNAAGLALTLLLAILIGLVAPVDPEVTQIAMRTRVSLSDVVVALAAGSAGALAFTTGLSAAVVGGMGAVARLPPVVNGGRLLGAGRPEMATGAMLLAATNIVCINLAGVGTFLWQKVNPQHWWEAERAKRIVRIAATIWLALLALLIALILLARQ